MDSVPRLPRLTLALGVSPAPWFGIRFLSFGSNGTPTAPAAAVEPSFRRMMVYLFVGSRGGQNRVRIVETLRSEPSNSNKLSEKLSLDYKTIQHHLKLLEQNGVIVSNERGAYGAVFFLTPYFERHFDSVKSMWARFGQS